MFDLISLCVRRRGLVTLLGVLLLVLGFQAARQAPLDVFPEFVPSQAEIQTEAPGMTPEQVEQRVTRQIETYVNGVPGLASLRSESIPGLSVVKLTFAEGSDPVAAREAVSQRLAQISRALPASAGAPQLSPLVSSTMDLLKIGLTSDTLDALALRDMAEWTLKPRLLAVPGVAHVVIFGGEVRELQVVPHFDAMAAGQFTLDDIAVAAKAALDIKGAGFVDTASQRILVRAPSPIADPAVLRDAVLAVRGSRVYRIGDVAEVREGAALKSGDARIMGKPGVLLSLASQYGANTLETTHAAEVVLAQIRPALEAQGVKFQTGLHRPANFIEVALANLSTSLLLSAVLILLVLYAFMRDVRAALVAFLAIPLSLVVGIMVMRAFGQTLNTLTLGGFAVALGVLVDDAIIGIENTQRRLRERLGEGGSVYQVIVAATMEVRAPVVYATLVVITVFIPVLLIDSLEGRFVGPLAQAFIVSVLASLLVALTLTPALCALLLVRGEAKVEAGWITSIKRWQAHVLAALHQRWKATLVVMSLMLVGTLALVPLLGGRFLPEFREGHLVVQMSASLPGVSLGDMNVLGERVSAALLAQPFVDSVSFQVGRAELSEDTWGPHRSEFHVELKPDSGVDPEDAQQRIRSLVGVVPGMQTEVVSFLGDRISESLSGESGQVVIKIFGNDLDALDATADKVVAALTGQPHVIDLQFRRQDGTPMLDIEPRPGALARYGIKAAELLDIVGSAYEGADLGEVQDGLRTVHAVTRISEERRSRPEALRQLPIATPLGVVPLAKLAGVTLREGRYSIDHEGAVRRVVVSFNVDGASVQATAASAQQVLAAKLQLPAGVSVQFAGEGEAEQRTRSQLLMYAGLALVLVVILLQAAFRWPRNAALVMANLPFSLVGGLLAVAATGLDLSLGVVVGLVTVFGISARNGILQLSHYEHMVHVEGCQLDFDTISRGANERLVPILMTAVVTALGLLPLAVGMHRPGQEIEGPMAVAVLGGLASSTVLNLLVLPLMAVRWVKPATSS